MSWPGLLEGCLQVQCKRAGQIIFDSFLVISRSKSQFFNRFVRDYLIFTSITAPRQALYNTQNRLFYFIGKPAVPCVPAFGRPWTG